MPGNGTPAQIAPESLEALRAQLEATGDYRVLRRLREVDAYSAPTAAQKFVALYLDTETTGLDAGSDSIIELAIVAFEYDLEGNIYRLLRTFSQLEDPGSPLSPEVKAITGITDEELAGRSIDDGEVERVIGDARLVIAHNAAFDRPFVERRLPRFANLPWACSATDIAWRELGFGSASMEFLAYRHGFFFEAHRALIDCRAGVQILASRDNGSGRTAMALLRDGALKSSVRIWAEGSPFSSKDVLKARRYRWNPTSKVWWTEVPDSEHEPELEWLAANVYGRRVPLPYFRISAAERYSPRVPFDVNSDLPRR